MKLHSLILSFGTAALLASSCSVFKPKDKTSTGTEIKSEAVNAPKKKGKNDRDKNSDLKAERGGVKPSKEQLCGGEWTVASVGEIKIETEENVPYVNFAPDGRFYASDGCNVINGDYVLRTDGFLSFANVLSTMKYCHDMEYSTLISNIFGEKRYSVDFRRIGQDSYLYIQSSAGKTLMTLRRHNMEFLNGNWRVTAIDGQPIDDEEANVFIDIAELKIHGNTGCNYYNGAIYTDPARTNAIDFSDMGVTRMACHKAEQEQKMLVALEETRTAIAGNDDTVLLMNKSGREVLTLKRIPIPQND